jgi:uncharacterized protein YhaN
MAAYEGASAWLDAHPDAPVLPASLEARLADTVKRLAIIAGQVESSASERARHATELESITVETSVLDAAEAIERLSDQSGAVTKALADIPQLQAEHAAVSARIAGLLARLDSPVPPALASQLIPARAAESRANTLIAQYGAVAAAVEQAPAALARAASDIAEVAASLDALPPEVASEAVATLVAEIRTDGDPASRAEQAAHTEAASRAALSAALAMVPGWQGDALALIALTLPPPAQFERLAAVWRDAAGEVTAKRERLSESTGRRTQAMQRLAALTAGGAVADADAVAAARRHRDQGWELIYRLAFTDSAPSPAEQTAFAGAQTVPLAYVASVQQADARADQRVLQADLIAKTAEARRVVEAAEAEYASAEAALREAEDRAKTASRAWSIATEALPLGMAPAIEEVRSFLAARDRVIDRQSALTRDLEAQRRLGERHASWAERLRAALEAPDLPTLGALLAAAESRIAAAAERARQRIALTARLREHQRQHQTATYAAAEAERHMAEWRAAWTPALAALGRPAEEHPGVTADILALLREMDQEIKTAAQLAGRISDMHADNAAFTAAVSSLLNQVAPDLLSTVLEFDSHTVMPGACPGIHAVQPLQFRKGEPFSVRPAPLDGVDARTSAGHDGGHVDGSISRTIGITLGETITHRLAGLRALRERLLAHRERAARRGELQKILDQADRNLAQMQDRHCRALAEHDAVLRAIGAESLEEAEQRLATARDRAQHFLAREQAVAELRAGGDGLDLAQLRAELASLSADDVAAALATAEVTMATANTAAQDAASAVARQSLQMEQRAGDGGYDAAIAAQHAAVASISRVLEEALLARLSGLLLERAMGAVEANSGSALLARIGGYFRTLTGGAYERIVSEDGEDGRLVFKLVPTDHPDERNEVKSLSEGTRDQLFLALRLAAIEDHVTTAPPLPFVGDDILQTSDDARAFAALHALLSLSQHVQVILLTHHRHIVDLAERLPAGCVHICDITRLAA